MKTRILLVIGLIVCITSFSQTPNSWTGKTSNSTHRRGGSGFAIDDTIYMGLGYGGSCCKLSDFWKYSPVTNSWTQVASFPGTARWFATSFAIGGKGYIAFGHSTDHHKDVWEYDPATNLWNQKADFPGTARSYVACFVIGDKAYVVGGTGPLGMLKELWEYTPATDTWVQKSSMLTYNRHSAVAFSINGKGYVTTGLHSGSFAPTDMQEYNPSTDTWATKANFPAIARNGAMAFTIGNKGYVGIGAGFAYNSWPGDLWEYDAVADNWTQRANFMGGGREGVVAVVANGKAYVGSGGAGSENRDWYEYTPPLQPLTGAYTINSSQPTAGGNYNSFTDAFNDINSKGIDGAVIFNVAAGQVFNEILPALTATGDENKSIIFQKSGVGANPVIKRTDAGTISTSVIGGQGDAVVKIDGSDHIVFDGVDVEATNQGIDYGYLIRKASPTDGSKHITLKNATVALARGTNPYCTGIYISNLDSLSVASSDTGVAITSTGGRHENISIRSMTIKNVLHGILAIGYNHTTAPYNFYDQNIQIGAEGEGNVLHNFGGINNAAVYGILTRYQNAITISHNTLNNRGSSGVASVGNMVGIFLSTANGAASATVNRNSLDLQGSNGNLYAIFNGGSSGNLSISSNTVKLSSTENVAGAFIHIGNGAGQEATQINIDDNILAGSNYATNSGGYLIYDAASITGTMSISRNVVSGTIIKGTYSSLYGLYQNHSSTGSYIISNNNFSNIVNNSAAGLFMIYSSTGVTATKQISNNIISGGVAGNHVVGLAFNGRATVFNNRIFNLTATLNSNNYVRGMQILGGNEAVVYNNIIGDLKTPAAHQSEAVIGIFNEMNASGTSLKLYYNTVYLSGTSSSSSFGSSCLRSPATFSGANGMFELKNNIFVNECVAKGSGVIAAFRQNLVSSANYHNSSNNNLFYAPVIYYDGTNAYYNIANFKTAKAPRESNSIYERPPFISTNSADSLYLRIDKDSVTGVESGGSNIPTIMTDIDGDMRSYTTPDIGADEFVSNPYIYNVTGGGSYCSGDTGVVVGLDNSQAGISYQLLLNDTTVIGSAIMGTGGAISFGSQTVPGVYSVKATNLYQGVNSRMIGYATVSIDSLRTPTVVISATSSTIVQGTTVTFTAVASHGGSGPLYQWMKNGINVGSNSAVFTTSDLVQNDEITCVVTSNKLCVDTNIAISNSIKINIASGTLPVVEFVSSFPYNGNAGVSPMVGQAGLYNYRVKYRSSSSTPPSPGYPKVGIDRNGDGDYIDNGEGLFTMTKLGSGTDWTNGELYSYTANLTLGSNYKYRFFANDSVGNAAVANHTITYNGPIVTSQTLDLSIFADDITFSKTNPAVGETFTVFAKVKNNSPYSASNVNVRFYTDSVYYSQTTIASIAANSTTTVNMNFNYNVDGFYPIKVWIDSAGVLGETNQLNNYAIRPLIVGHFTVPGGINISAAASPQTCPSGAVFTGNAYYTGLNLSGQPPVLGATVTVTATSSTGSTVTASGYTITNGYYNIYMPGLSCATAYSYTVSITDYTLTGGTSAQSLVIPCVTCGGGGGGIASPAYSPGASAPSCIISGQAFVYNIPVHNSGSAASVNNVVKVYNDGVLQHTYNAASINAGQTVTYTPSFTLSEGTYNLSYVHSYEDNDGNTDEISASNAINVQLGRPDLYPANYYQETNVSFKVRVHNGSCTGAGSSWLYIYDSTALTGAYELKDSVATAAIGANSWTELGYNFSNWSIGNHYVKLMADGQLQHAELSENNNVMKVVVLLYPELEINTITASTSNAQVGNQITYTAEVKNSSVAAGAFKVRFKAGNDVIGSDVPVNSLGMNGTVNVTSGSYTVPVDGCNKVITAVVDVDEEVAELNESNNRDSMNYGVDFIAGVACNGIGSSCNHYRVYVTNPLTMTSVVKNIGSRNAGVTNVRFKLAGNVIGTDNIASVSAAETKSVQLTHTFNTVGSYVIAVEPDYDGQYCEVNENNNLGYIYVDVVQDLPDLRILSQHISPSNLNPNPGQSVTVVASIQNIGEIASEPCFVRFKIDGAILGSLVAINAIYPGQDTTIQATATYTGNTVGPKIFEVRVDSAHVQLEKDTTNNAATRAIIVGAAPDFASAIHRKISFSTATLTVGATVQVCNYIRNYGGAAGTATLRFYHRVGATKSLIGSLPVSLNGNDSINRCINWVVPSTSGKIITELVSASPEEFNIFNNIDSVSFSASAAAKQNQSITFESIPVKCRATADFDPGATASSGLAVSYTSSNPAVAVVVGNMIRIKGTGSTTITARQGGDATFNAASPVATVLTVVNRVAQQISMDAIPSKQFGDADFTITASSTAGLPITFTSLNTNIATVHPTTGLTHINAGGSVAIRAQQAGNTCYSPAATSRLLVISQVSSQITFPQIADKNYGDAPFSPGAISTSPYKIKYQSSNKNIIAFSNSGMAVIKGVGPVTITAYQDEGKSFAAPAPVSQSFVVNKGNQVVSFDALTNKQVASAFKLKANAPGGAVSFSSSNTTIAEVMPGNNLKCKAIGVVTITARQRGNHLYNPATATQVLTIVAGAGKGEAQPVPFTLAAPISEMKLQAYPNPATTYLNISFSAKKSGKASILISNPAGQVMMRKEMPVQIGSNVFTLDLTSMLPGTYILQLSVGEELHQLTILKVGANTR